MSFALRPRTERGEAVVAAAESLVEGFAERAAAADAANQVDRHNFDELVRTGVAAAFVPQELGGLGLESLHDWVLTIATLARGDASTAISVNMHLGISRGLVLAHRDAQQASDVGAADALAAPLRGIVSGDMVICATATEPGTDNLHPMTEATRDDEGWRIDGRKIFVTLSPIATHLAMNLRVRRDEGDQLAMVMLPMSTPEP